MSKQLSKLINDKYKPRLLNAPQHAIATLATLVHDETPHDTFAAQRGWRMEINDSLVTNNSGDFIAGARQFKLGDTLKMANSVPYIRRLEYGWSRQAPAGMLRVNAARWDEFVEHGIRQAL